MTQRDTDIDLMRGWSMIIVIALHILPYYPAFPGAGFIQWSQMVVPLLLYCSIRVSKPPESLDLRHYMYGVYKRTRRLIVPYFVFLCIYALVHYALMYFYPSVRTLSLAWWVANITLTGGIDFNWLVLLFIGLSVWIPLVQHLSLRNPRWSHIITSVLLLFSTAAFFLQDLLHPFYRFWMVPLWLVFVPLFFQLIQIRHTVWALFRSCLIWSTVFVCIYLYASYARYSLLMRDHKYPPDIFYLSYSMACISLIQCLLTLSTHRWSLGEKIILPWSIYSYDLYFAHIIIIYILDVCYPFRDISIWTFAIVTYGGSILGVLALRWIYEKIKQSRRVLVQSSE